MDNQREEEDLIVLPVALPKALWEEVGARTKMNGCGINDIVERVLLAYFDLTGTSEPGASA